MNLMEMRLTAARCEAACNAQLLAALEKHSAAKAALRQARRYAKQCKTEAISAMAEMDRAEARAKKFGVSVRGKK